MATKYSGSCIVQRFKARAFKQPMPCPLAYFKKDSPPVLTHGSQSIFHTPGGPSLLKKQVQSLLKLTSVLLRLGLVQDAP